MIKGSVLLEDITILIVYALFCIQKSVKFYEAKTGRTPRRNK